MKHVFLVAGSAHEIELTPAAAGAWQVEYQGRSWKIEQVEAAPGRLVLRVEGRLVTLHTAQDRLTHWIAADGRTYALQKPARTRRGPAVDHNPAGTLRAPMPGQVRAVYVQEGEAVTRGQTVLLLEAMKMEIRIQAPADGMIAHLAVRAGCQVEKDQLLAEIT